MDEKKMNKLRELLGDDVLQKVTGGSGIDEMFPTPDVEEVKSIARQIYEMFGLEVAVSYATTLLGCTRKEVESWFAE